MENRRTIRAVFIKERGSTTVSRIRQIFATTSSY